MPSLLFPSEAPGVLRGCLLDWASYSLLQARPPPAIPNLSPFMPPRPNLRGLGQLCQGPLEPHPLWARSVAPRLSAVVVLNGHGNSVLGISASVWTL